MKYLELKDNLKKEVKSLYIIEGNDNYLVQQTLATLKQNLVEGMEEFNYLKLDASELKAGDYKNILNTLPFGSAYRLVVLENITAVGVKAIEE